MTQSLNLLLLISLILFIVISVTIPEMYMDEIFHYSQTLSFHQGKHFQPKLQSEPHRLSLRLGLGFRFRG